MIVRLLVLWFLLSVPASVVVGAALRGATPAVGRGRSTAAPALVPERLLQTTA